MPDCKAAASLVPTDKMDADGNYLWELRAPSDEANSAVKEVLHNHSTDVSKRLSSMVRHELKENMMRDANATPAKLFNQVQGRDRLEAE